MGKKSYRRFSEEDKVRALKRHLLEKVAVSVICDELGIGPSLFYTWQQRLFEQAPTVMGRGDRSRDLVCDKRQIVALEELLRKREEALAELVTELMALKKRSSGVA